MIVGGIISRTDVGSAVYRNCYNMGNVTGARYLGGIVGQVWNPTNTTFENCYNIGTITGSSDVGQIVGVNSGGTVTNCFYLDSLSGTPYGATNKTESYMKSDSFVSDLNAGATIWERDVDAKLNNGYPILSWQKNI